MKITLLLPDLRGGGAERVSVDLADAFARLGCRVEFVLLQAKGEFLAQVEERYKVVDLDVGRMRNAIAPLSRHIRENCPDGLIAAMWPLSFIASIAVKSCRRRCPVLIVEHTTLSRQYAHWGRLHHVVLRASLALGFRLADARAGVSSGVAEDAAKLAAYPVSGVATLYNPIPTRPAASAQALDIAESFWGRPKGKRIITVGNLKAVKNHALLLRAFAALGTPAACLLILGQGGLEAELRAQAVQLQISGQVVFAGFHPDPTAFYQTADLFVLSSDYEGLPTVLIEALGCGLPVVSTDCPSGPAEILENGRYGRLTPVGDTEALARAMQEALAAPHDPEALKRRAADFAPERAARAYLEALGLT